MQDSDAETTAPHKAKTAACNNCRSVKAKCEIVEGSDVCIRCERRGQSCVRLAVQKSGRPKGSKNQQTSVERALQVLEREVARFKRPRDDDDEIDSGITRSQPSFERHSSGQQGTIGSTTLERANSSSTHASNYITPFMTNTSIPQLEANTSRPISTIPPAPVSAPLPSVPQYPIIYPSTLNAPTIAREIGSSNHNISPHSLASHTSHPTDAEAEGEDGGFSNPVRLLAEAAEEESRDPMSWIDQAVVIRPSPLDTSDLPLHYTLPDTLRAMVTEGPIDPRVGVIRLDTSWLAQGLEHLLSDTAPRKLTDEDKRFFKPSRNQVKRDLGPEYDPLELALLTSREIKAFFATFFSRLHPLLPVLDPALHTVEFVQGRSAFLLTAICAHGAALTVGAEEATKRLRIHAQRLSELISRRGFASVEIVQAFLIWISWLPSSHPFQEERLWHETKYAINMAVELEIAKNSQSQDPGVQTEASLLACLEGVRPDDTRSAGLIIRNRQRLWLHLFLWDSSLSLAFGKATRFSQDHLTRDESWCFHPLATSHDTVTTAYVILRRRLVALSESLRSEILTRGFMTSDWVTGKVDEILGPWRSDWSKQCESSPFLDLIFRHTRLWSLSYALQSISARGGSVEALTSECFSSALATCQFVCEQLRESRSLCDFPNTMGPMVSFEALLAVRFCPPTFENGTSSRARVLGLLSQLSSLLEREGSTPPHRLGTAAVYGRHLQVYLRRQTIALCLAHDQQQSRRYNGQSYFNDLSAITAFQPEPSLDRVFNSNWASPTDQAQSSMTLDWDSTNTLNFLDPATGWTDEFFRVLGYQQ